MSDTKELEQALARRRATLAALKSATTQWMAQNGLDKEPTDRDLPKERGQYRDAVRHVNALRNQQRVAKEEAARAAAKKEQAA